LAAANIWSPLSVQAVKLRQIFNLALPANEFVNLAELGTEGNIEDYREIQLDGPQRDALHEFHWLPTRHGALLKTLPVHEPNDLYDTTFRLFTLQSPFRMGKTQRAIDLLLQRVSAQQVGRADAGQEKPEKQDDRCRIISKSPEARGTDCNERDIRNDVPEIRNAGHGAAVGEQMIALILRHRG
jgi:hypothetical protein